MKIIGEQGGGIFIATVTRVEIEKLHDKYYGKEKIPDTRVGHEYDLSAGFDFREEIKRSCKEMSDAMAQFKRAQDAMIRFSSMMMEMPDSESKGGAA